MLALFVSRRLTFPGEEFHLLHISPNKPLAEYINNIPRIRQVVGALYPEEFSGFGAIKVDVQSIPYGDCTFDGLICCHILEHIEEDGKAMKEILRVLKPGGFAILQVPLALDLEKTLEDQSITDARLRKRIFGQTDHTRLYGQDYFSRLESAGFRVVKDNPYNNHWAAYVELDRHRLNRAEDVILCMKN